MAYKAIDIAKYIVTYCTERQQPISNLKLQKMMYYAWIEYYNKTQNYLFDDMICAWQLGPVVPEVYYEFCSYAGVPITRKFHVEVAPQDSSILSNCIDKYLPLPANALVNKTHESGKPWDCIYKDGEGLRKEIPFQMIIDMECQYDN